MIEIMFNFAVLQKWQADLVRHRALSCMSLTTTSTLSLRQTISRLRPSNGRTVITATRLNPASLRARCELGQLLPNVRGYASQQPPGGMGGIPNFLFQQPRQKGETLKEYVSIKDAFGL